MSKEKQEKKQKQTKTSIVDLIYKKSNHMLKDVHSITDLFFSEMFEALQRGETIEVRGFGTFSVQFRKGRKGMRNPKTGELVDTVPHSVVVFRPGKILSAAVRPIVKPEYMEEEDNKAEPSKIEAEKKAKTTNAKPKKPSTKK